MINPQWLELPYLEQISMAPKMFEPLRFDCIKENIVQNIQEMPHSREALNDGEVRNKRWKENKKEKKEKKQTSLMQTTDARTMKNCNRRWKA